jgi:sulfide dehydrogenase cytochrome subunit
MCEVARKLTEADIEAVAAHFDTQAFVPARQTADATKAAAGRRIHSRDCEACHSDAGRDAGADASILAGQWMPYLQLSLAEFASGNRPQLEKMKEKLDNLSAADLEALVHFYGSQQ